MGNAHAEDARSLQFTRKSRGNTQMANAPKATYPVVASSPVYDSDRDIPMRDHNGRFPYGYDRNGRKLSKAELAIKQTRERFNHKIRQIKNLDTARKVLVDAGVHISYEVSTSIDDKIDSKLADIKMD